MMRDMDNAQHGQNRKPDEHDGAKPSADGAGALRLHGEKAQEDADGQRNDEGLDLRRGNEQAFHRGKDGNGGRDHAIPVKQGGARDSHHDHSARREAFVFLPFFWKREREQRQDSAFAMVVRAHDHAQRYFTETSVKRLQIMSESTPMIS